MPSCRCWPRSWPSERDALGDRFGCATPDEAALTHAIYHAAIRSHETGEVVRVGG